MTKANYMNLPYDLSGAMAKNRFRNEILWGLKKVLEIFRLHEEFTMVFDYKCDIEIHLPNNFEFYQLKTQNTGTYTVEGLLKKNNVGVSILGKLYLLKYNQEGIEQDEVIVAVVSNIPLNDGIKLHLSSESVLFTDIDEKAVENVKKDVTKELSKQEEILLKNTYFIRTSMDLINPEKSLIGELAFFFENILDQR
ncbi:DUF4297 domain-containing protein [Paenibacillus frigoriresistens]|uniref:dsDNA nuclease domain-containing protein n=1 Tax=Paenibacillus alginolyticus TaxID=59839 RepID=UPI0015669CEF|nr:dsDNA nuclease domain-containing protein [Paenibacillus frigoriresistens]NRF95286.1 DUF4297 domain-containing protein [Paenibacillus frigoriresistens]